MPADLVIKKEFLVVLTPFVFVDETIQQHWHNVGSQGRRVTHICRFGGKNCSSQIYV